MTVPTKSEALTLIDQKLDEAIDTALKNFAADMLIHGATTDEINAALARYVPEIETWRQATRAKMERIVSDPWAPSHEAH
jgi:hypothetical protein